MEQANRYLSPPPLSHADSGSFLKCACLCAGDVKGLALQYALWPLGGALATHSRAGQI